MFIGGATSLPSVTASSPYVAEIATINIHSHNVAPTQSASGGAGPSVQFLNCTNTGSVKPGGPRKTLNYRRPPKREWLLDTANLQVGVQGSIG